MPALEEVRSLLPWWVLYGNVLYVFLAAFVASLASALVTALIVTGPVRKSASAHWTERARHCHAARKAMNISSFVFYLICGLFFVMSGSALAGPISRLSTRELSLCGIVAAALGISIIGRRTYAAVSGEPISWRRYLNDILASQRGLPFFILFIALIMPSSLNLYAETALAAGALYILVHNILGKRYLLMALGLARPASDRLKGIVDDLSRRMGICPKFIYEVKLPYANAYAVPTSSGLIFSERLLSILDDREIAAIAAHELAHLAGKGVKSGHRTALNQRLSGVQT